MSERIVRRSIKRAVIAILEEMRKNAGGITALAESGRGEIELTIAYSKDFERLEKVDEDDDAELQKFVAESDRETFTFNLSDFISMDADHPGPSQAVTDAVIETLNGIGPAYIFSSEAKLQESV